MSLQINNDANTPQPTVLAEELVQIQTDQFALDGSMSRNKLGSKKQATITWDWLTPTQYQLVLSYFTTGSGVYYSNSTSNYSGGTLTFSGMPSFKESAYIQGSSLFRKFEATIREL